MGNRKPQPLEKLGFKTLASPLFLIRYLELNMSASQLNVKEVRMRLEQDHGEVVPKNWSRAQVMLRLTELEGNQCMEKSKKQQTPLRQVEVEINRAAKKKATLIEYVQNMGVPLTGNETIDQLKVKAMGYASTKTMGAAEEFVGFGKHSALTYHEVMVGYPQYCEWVQTMAQEGQTCPKLQRLAAWLKTQDHEMVMPKVQTRPRKGGAVGNSSSSSSNTDVAQLTNMVAMLAQEVKSLKEDKEVRRKTAPSMDVTSSSEWEKPSQ